MTPRPKILFLFFILYSTKLFASSEETLFVEDLFPELKTIIQKAIYQAPLILEEKLKVLSAEGDTYTFSSSLYPKLNGYFSVLARKEYRKDLQQYPSYKTAIGQVNLSYPLYHWGIPTHKSQIGKFQLKLAQGNLQEAYRTLIHEVRLLYLRLMLQNYVLEMQRIQVEQTKKEYAQQEKLLQEGKIAPLQAQETWARLEEAEENLIAQTNEFLFLSNRFAYLTSCDDLSFASLRENPVLMLPLSSFCDDNSIDALVKLPTESIRVQNIKNRIEIEKLYYKIYSRETWPLFNAFSNVTQDQVDAVGKPAHANRTALMGGINVTWNLFDGFETKGKKLSSDSRKRLLSHQLEALSLQIYQENQQLHRSLNLNRQRIQSRDARLQMILQQLKTTEELFAQDKTSESELHAIQKQCDFYQIQALQARIDFLLDLSRLYSNLGLENEYHYLSSLK